MFLATGLGLTASAGIIVTAEAAGVQSTTRTGVVVETFDSLAAGSLGAYSSIIGDYSSGAQIVNPNAFGGSGQTKYISVGAQSAPSTMYTLDFGKHITYFGLYWAAGDRLNVLEFFDGATKVGSFTTSDWAPALSNAYFGNPNTGQNTNEKYAFLNFDATAGTKFNMVKFINNPTSTGFETDNHTILAAPEVPEPSTWAMMIGAAAALGFARKRKLV
jgi:hypothetical protein